MSRTISLRSLLTLLALGGLALVFPALGTAQAADCAGLSGTDLAQCTAAQQAGGGSQAPDESVSSDGTTGAGEGEEQQTGGSGGTEPDTDTETTGAGGGEGDQDSEQDQSGSGGGTQQNDSQSDEDGTVDQSAGTGGRTPPDVDCVADFDTREAAQEVLDADTNDPFILDADGDGVACENLPREGVVVVRRVARVELARTGPHALWIGLAGGLCLAGGVALRRGRTES